PFKEQIHARFRTVCATKPDGARSNQVTHHDPVRMPLANRQFVDPDDQRPRRTCSPQLLRHVLLLQRLDRLPVQMGLPGNIANRRDTTPPPYPEGKTLRVKGIVGQPVQTLLLHLPAPSAPNSANLHLQPNTPIPAGKISHPTNLAIVKRPVRTSADSANRFFPRRRRLRTTAYGSPNTPATLRSARNPGKLYVSYSCLIFRMQSSYHTFTASHRSLTLDRKELATY